MFDITKTHACLDSLVSLESNISKHAPTYLNEDIITKAIPQNAVYDDYVANIIKGSVDKCLYNVLNKKKITTLVKSTIADFKLFDGRADFNNKNANLGRFCFIQFEPKNNEDVVLALKRISIQIDTNSPDLKFYLFSDDNPNAAIKVIATPYVNNRGVQWFDVLTNTDTALNLPPMGDDGVVYYLGYFESDLAPGAQTIKKAVNINEAPCGSCGGMEQQRIWHATRNSYVDMRIGYVDSQNLDGIKLPDMDNAVYVNQNNFGMNIDCSITCDISGFICGNKNLFIEPLAMQAAIDLLYVIIHSERDNIDLQKAQQGCIYALNGNSDNNYKGLLRDYDKMIDALDVDMSGMNRACLNCSQKPRIINRYV